MFIIFRIIYIHQNWDEALKGNASTDTLDTLMTLVSSLNSSCSSLPIIRYIMKSSVDLHNFSLLSIVLISHLTQY